MTTAESAEPEALVQALADVAVEATRTRGRTRHPVWSWLGSPITILVIDVAALFAGIVAFDQLNRATIVYLVAVPIWLALLGSYRWRIAPSVQVDLVPLLGALASPIFVLAWIRTPAADNLVRDMPVASGLVIVSRLFSYAIQRAARRRSNNGERVLIVGSGVLGCQVAEILLGHPEYGLKPVGFVDGFPDDKHLPLPTVANIDTFDAAVRAQRASRIIVAFGANREAELVDVLRASAEAQIEVHIIPRLFELGVTPSGPDTDIVWGFPLQRARRAALRTPAWRTKRLVDVCVSSVVLLVTAPFLLAGALAVRLTSKGPILFRQSRVGQRGDVVEIYKLRSIRVSEDADTKWGTKQDDRVTRVGKVLRATDIDELPQLFNVLRGDMSLVGPRPERPHFAGRFDREVFRYRDRLRVPVGLTGWAQVHGLRGDTSIEERARFDDYYIEHWSPWFDAVILARTFTHIVKRLVEALVDVVRRD